MKNVMFLPLFALVAQSALAADVCMIKLSGADVAEISCNGKDFDNAQAALSGVLQQKLNQGFELRSVNTVGLQLIYTLIKP